MTSLFPESGENKPESGFSTELLKQQAQSLSNFIMSTKNSTAAGGYLAFPPISSDATIGAIEHGLGNAERHYPGLSSQGSSSNPITVDGSEMDNTDRQKDEEEKRRRMDKEHEIATEGEFEWVRSGGVLRDTQGRRDKVRTESIKQEIRLREREKRLTDQWDSYEQKWHTLLASRTPVSFKTYLGLFPLVHHLLRTSLFRPSLIFFWNRSRFGRIMLHGKRRYELPSYDGILTGSLMFWSGL